MANKINLSASTGTFCDNLIIQVFQVSLDTATSLPRGSQTDRVLHWRALLVFFIIGHAGLSFLLYGDFCSSIAKSRSVCTLNSLHCGVTAPSPIKCSLNKRQCLCDDWDEWQNVFLYLFPAWYIIVNHAGFTGFCAYWTQRC